MDVIVKELDIAYKEVQDQLEYLYRKYKEDIQKQGLAYATKEDFWVWFIEGLAE